MHGNFPANKTVCAPYIPLNVWFWPTLAYIHQQMLRASNLTTGNAHSEGWPEPYIYRYIQCTYGIFGREITIYTVIYGADIRFWPTLQKCKCATLNCPVTILTRSILEGRVHSACNTESLRVCLIRAQPWPTALLPFHQSILTTHHTIHQSVMFHVSHCFFRFSAQPRPTALVPFHQSTLHHVTRLNQSRIYTLYNRKFGGFPAKNTAHIPYIYVSGQLHIPHRSPNHNISHCLFIFVRLARIVYIHRIWPYIWWFPCQKYRIHTVYIWFLPTLHISLAANAAASTSCHSTFL